MGVEARNQCLLAYWTIMKSAVIATFVLLACLFLPTEGMRNRICPMLLRPVCGSDGVTYDNSCLADSKGQVCTYTVSSLSPCYLGMAAVTKVRKQAVLSLLKDVDKLRVLKLKQIRPLFAIVCPCCCSLSKKLTCLPP